jgi:MFS family permease
MYEISLVTQAFTSQGCKEEFSCSSIQSGILISCFQIGILCGTIFFGTLSDRYGRILCFKSSILVATFSCMILLFSVNYYMMNAAFFVLGLGAGGENALVSVVFVEFCPPSKRSYLTLLGLFWGAGGCIYSGIAVIVTSTNSSSLYDWRYIIAADCVIKIVASIFRLYMIETPTYYFSKGETAKAELILNKISIENTGKELSFLDQEYLIPKNQALETKMRSGKHLFFRLFSKEYRTTAICFGMVFHN